MKLFYSRTNYERIQILQDDANGNTNKDMKLKYSKLNFRRIFTIIIIIIIIRQG